MKNVKMLKFKGDSGKLKVKVCLNRKPNFAPSKFEIFPTFSNF